MPKLIDLSGMKFERIFVLSRAEDKIISGKKLTVWSCLCQCGEKIEVFGTHLRSGHTRSCGCLQKDMALLTHSKHKMSESREYKIWHGMIRRCSSKSGKNYINYVLRGISVCEEWKEFSNFYRDMGNRTKGMSIDRIDNDKGYFRENCRWASYKEQSRNTRRNVFLNVDGIKMCISDWAEKSGIQDYKIRNFCKTKGNDFAVYKIKESISRANL